MSGEAQVANLKQAEVELLKKNESSSAEETSVGENGENQIETDETPQYPNNQAINQNANNQKILFAVTVERKAASWLSAKNEGFSGENTGLDILTVENKENGHSLSIRVQSVANHPKYPEGNTIIGDFTLVYKTKSSLFKSDALLITNTTTLSGLKIGENGFMQDSQGRERKNTARWLMHSLWGTGRPRPDRNPFSGGCIMPKTYGEMLQFFVFLTKEGVTDGMKIPGKIIEEVTTSNNTTGGR